MEYKEKYEQALERARIWQNHLYETNDRDYADELNYIFPELKENKNERIRNWLIGYFHQYKEDGMEKYANGLKVESILAWLEKQHTDPYNGICFDYYGHRWSICARDNEIEIVMDGIPVRHFSYKDCEHVFEGESALESIKEEGVNNQNCVKPSDEVEPKFHEGDWITDGYIHYKITDILDDRYIIESIYTKRSAILFEYENRYHIWTIKDAKDGDVLCTYECDEPKTVFILKGAPKKGYALNYHCYYNIMYPHFDSDSEEGCLAPKDENVKPATKEQRDLLFQKMKQAGYEWDADKKELKKLEEKGDKKPTDVEQKFHEGDKIVSNKDGKVYTVGTTYDIPDDNICLHGTDRKHKWTNRDDLDINYHLWTSEDAKKYDADKVIE